ncbi:TrmH family RNA methyltransferase [Usitatibacter palustris]|uniref:23S rRNA (Guanosine-2'-O-)-methyltransferase RlmB n=1 Tax=Usitatibacter palustris TaxID=2732487 RepID=A0A6M4H3H8_9PROT|nr:RNA methyltransferase [Usitatibacter palustris]QJR14161.1 23S rRNA (guanosine-2'-O-)-methyltransferase RlmB [Usitatibacter palustris]
MKAITSRDNAGYKAMAKLVASTAERKRRALSVLEGAHLVAAFLDSGRELDSLMVSRSALERAEVAALADRAHPAAVTVISDALFDALSTLDSATGVIAAAPTPEGVAVPANASLVVLLEDVQDPGNVGTLLRSAAAVGAGHVMLSKTCAFAWSLKVIRAGVGAHFALNIVEDADLAAWLAAFRGKSVALAGGAKESIYDLDLTGPLAIIVGNEGAGVSESLMRAATKRARIPMPGRMESLNAGVAGSVALFEALRQRQSSADKRG